MRLAACRERHRSHCPCVLAVAFCGRTAPPGPERAGRPLNEFPGPVEVDVRRERRYIDDDLSEPPSRNTFTKSTSPTTAPDDRVDGDQTLKSTLDVRELPPPVRATDAGVRGESDPVDATSASTRTEGADESGHPRRRRGADGRRQLSTAARASERGSSVWTVKEGTGTTAARGDPRGHRFATVDDLASRRRPTPTRGTAGYVADGRLRHRGREKSLETNPARRPKLEPARDCGLRVPLRGAAGRSRPRVSIIELDEHASARALGIDRDRRSISAPPATRADPDRRASYEPVASFDARAARPSTFTIDNNALNERADTKVHDATTRTVSHESPCRPPALTS